MEWNVMELKVWFEGKTLKETPKFYWELSLYCLKIDNKKSVEWGRPPPPGYGKFHTFFFLFLRPSLTAIELSTKKEKTRKILEDNLKNMIDGANIVVTSKCTEIWALYDEMQDELQMTTIGRRQWNEYRIWNDETMNTEYGID